MVHMEGELVVGAPPDVVFDFAADLRHAPLYDTRALWVRKLSRGPIAAGTRFRAGLRALFGATVVVATITEHDPPERLRLAALLPGLTATGAMDFTAAPGGTRLHWSWDVALHGWRRAAAPIVLPEAVRAQRRAWLGLRDYLERAVALDAAELRAAAADGR